MKVTKRSQRDAKELFRACRVQGVLDENRVREIVRRVIESKPRGYLGILNHFRRLVQLELARRTARIESAVPLPPPLQSSLESNLTRRYGPGLAFQYSQNPALLGGVRIHVGSDFYDGSIQGRLTALEQSF